MSTPVTVKVRSVRKVENPSYVCDLTVADNHNLFVKTKISKHPILAHNCLDENLKELSFVNAHYYSLLNLCMQYGNTDFYDAAFGKEQSVTITQVDMSEDLIHYCALDVISLHHIKRLQLQRAEDIGHDKYESIAGEQISDKLHLFSAMEFHGSPIDLDHLFFLQSNESPLVLHGEAVKKALNNTEGVQKTNRLLMRHNNIPTVGLFGATNSNVFDVSKRLHLNTLMFEALGLEPLETGKNGDGKIDKAFQSKYEDVVEVALYNELKKVEKLRSSYVKAFIAQWGVDEDMRTDQAIRPMFHFLRVVTGRSSATKPSLHQIPSRNSVTKLISSMFPERSNLGEHIKRLFVARKGRIIIKIDFSAHEVRCFHLDSYVHTEAGMMQFKSLLDIPMEDKPKVYSLNHATGEVELKRVGTQSIHEPEDDMYEVEYEGGMIPLTGNHLIWSATRNKYVRVDNLLAGEEVVIEE